MSLWSLQKWLLMLLFQFTAKQRGEFFTLLAFCWSTTIQITDGFLGRCGSVGLQCGFTRGLMKTWQPSRLKSILWGSQLMHIQANLQMSIHPVDGVGSARVKSFLPGKQSQTLLAEFTGLGPGRWNSDVEGKLVGGGKTTSGRSPDGCCPAGGDLGPGRKDGFPSCLRLTVLASLPWVKLKGVSRNHKWGIWNKKIVSV